ncbi:10504_t:CDS:1 [Ambispora gerdemannii]|uniref:10504_t:CDS:1 n=1 Tax=Ambispora gerdemannii TaxID=144530 RepID=A0A9N8V4D9_9GLOM|nr:10504_t:CDS:1 [Ambispora gerdemannii]
MIVTIPKGKRNSIPTSGYQQSAVGSSTRTLRKLIHQPANLKKNNNNKHYMQVALKPLAHDKSLPHNKSNAKPNQLLGINENLTTQSLNKPGTTSNPGEPSYLQENRSQITNLLPKSILRKNCGNQKQIKRKVSFAGSIVYYNSSKPNRFQETITKQQRRDHSVTFNAIPVSQINAYSSNLKDFSTWDIKEIKKDITEFTVLSYINTFDEKTTEYAKIIKDACFSFLVNELPRLFNPFDTDRHHHQYHRRDVIETRNGMCHDDGYQKLLNIYARLPFSWFKRVIESKNLGVTSTIRYKLAKDIINKRQELKISDKNEFAYMSFGTKHHQNITIVQKQKVPKNGGRRVLSKLHGPFANK